MDADLGEGAAVPRGIGDILDDPLLYGRSGKIEITI